MKTDKRNRRSLSRRDLLRSAATAAGAAGLAGAAPRVLAKAARSGALAGVAGAKGAAKAGWQALFNGKDLKQWDYNPQAWKIDEDGNLASPGKGGDIFSKQKFQDFTLLLDFNVTKGCNSGVFVRMASRKDWLHSSIEFQVLDSFGKKQVGKHDCGAMYDCKAPDHNAVRKAGEWNRMQITCFKNRIFVAINGMQIQDIDLNKWDTAHKNPDGSKNKFRDPVKKIQHPGFLALQTHGKPIMFRNIRLREITALAKCPKCGAAGPEGWYCARCKAVCAAPATIRCKACKKPVKAGTYCAEENRWHLAGKAPECPGCGNTKGMWCEMGCDMYYMTAGVSFCEKCEKPYAKTPAGCPTCKKKKG